MIESANILLESGLSLESFVQLQLKQNAQQRYARPCAGSFTLNQKSLSSKNTWTPLTIANFQRWNISDDSIAYFDKDTNCIKLSHSYEYMFFFEFELGNAAPSARTLDYQDRCTALGLGLVRNEHATSDTEIETFAPSVQRFISHKPVTLPSEESNLTDANMKEHISFYYNPATTYPWLKPVAFQTSQLTSNPAIRNTTCFFMAFSLNER